MNRLVYVLLFFTFPIFAQQKPGEILVFDKTYKDSLELYRAAIKKVQLLRNQGFMEANLEQITKTDSIFTPQFHVGNRYEWLRLDCHQIPSDWQAQLGNLTRQNIFNINELEKIKTRIIKISANNGYPFAQVWIDSFQVQNNQISATLNLQKNKLILLDELVMEGDTVISDAYLFRYLSINKGQIYRQNTLDNISKKLENLNFIKLKAPYFVSFTGKRADIHLDLEKRPASRFDVLLSLQPNPDVPNKLSISGNALLDLKNTLKQGERFTLDFQRLDAQIQQLKVSANYPYILGTALGIDARFEGYKRLKEYFNAMLEGGILYQINSNNYGKIFWNRTSTTVLSIDKNALNSTRQLPNTLDVATDAYGFEYLFSDLDYQFNPQRGTSFKIKTAIGNKKILKNNTIINYIDNQGFEYRKLYDTIALNTYQYKLEGHVEKYFSLKKNQVFKVSISGATILGKSPVLQNEQYRLGGLKTIRGFDEESLFATNFLLHSLEYRYILSNNSYFNFFSSYAVLQDFTKQAHKKNETFSFGVGILLETRAGLLNLTYALGKLNQNPIDFRSGKIHIGYIGLF